MSNNDYIIDQIKHIPPEILESHGVITKAKTRANGYPTFICPVCGNGTGKDGDGLAVYLNPDGWAFHCNRKGCHFDNIHLLALHYGLDYKSDFLEVLKRAADDFGIYGDVVTGSRRGNSAKNFSSKSPMTDKETKYFPPLADKEINFSKPLAQDYTKTANVEVVDAVDEKELAAMIEDDIAFSIKYLAASEYDKKNNMEVMQKYFPLEKYCLLDDDRRGLSLETLKYFRCGFHPAWIHPKIRLAGNPKNVQPTRRIIIPISPRHYIAVALKRDRSSISKNCWKMIAKTSDPSSIFGRQTITPKTEYIYIYEGEIDCLSGWQANQQRQFLKNSMDVLGVDSATDLETGEIIAASSIENTAYIATGGASNKAWIKALVAGLNYYNINPCLIIVFDDDDDKDVNAGRENAEKHCKTLIDLGFPAFAKFIPSVDK